MRHAMNSNTFAAVLAPAVLFALVGCGGNPDSTAPRSEVRVGPADSIAGAGVLQRVEQAITKPDRHSEEVTQLAAQIALLRAEVADLRRNLPSTSAAQRPAPDVTRDWRSDPDARDEVQAAERARVVSAEAAFRREDVDARWSQQAVAEVRAGLAEAHPSIRNAVRAVECRAEVGCSSERRRRRAHHDNRDQRVARAGCLPLARLGLMTKMSPAPASNSSPLTLYKPRPSRTNCTSS